MTPHSSLLAPHLQCFFAEYLLKQKRASPETVASYWDTFRLFLNFLKQTAGIEPSALRVSDMDSPVDISFLDSLEKQRRNSVRSRNIRLSAIRSFFRLISLRDAESVAIAQRVLAIPVKRQDKKLIGYLTRPELDALLAAPDRSQWRGRRDHALLLTMYNSGARVSEIIALAQDQVCFGSSTFLHLKGKGRKERSIPLWPHTAKVLKSWFHELQQKGGGPLAFPNARGACLSRDGVDYLLRKAVQNAALNCFSLNNKRVSCHVIRHSTAMHLLQAGVDIAVIALWLGHESIQTTHMYVEADLATKERALQKVAPVQGKFARFKADDALMQFLNSL